MLSKLFALINNPIKIHNKILERIIQNYSFLYITKNFQFDKNSNILQNIKESNIIIINQCNIQDQKTQEMYFIISFQKTVIIIKQLSLFLLSPLFSTHSNMNICFLSNTQKDFNQSINILYNEIQSDSNFFEEISNFDKNFCIEQSTPFIDEIWKDIRSCISAYLIKKSYLKLNNDRIENFFNSKNKIFESKIHENDFIQLRQIRIDKLFNYSLIYHIEREELMTIKRPNESNQFVQMDINKYWSLFHPFLANFRGTIKDTYFICSEFIKGENLENIKRINLTEDDKITIIYEIMLAVEHVHINNFILRDLCPRNVVIDQNKNAVIFDFDRMEYDKDGYENCFCVAPEVKSKGFSIKSDIYALGQLIYYVMNEGESLSNIKHFDDKYSALWQIYERCTSKFAQLRPSISDLILDFTLNFQSLIHNKESFEKYFNQIDDKIKIAFFHPKDPIYQQDIEFYYSHRSPDVNLTIENRKISLKKHIIIAGVPRSGKSTISRKISKCFGYQHISFDSIIAGIEKAFPETGVNSDAQTDLWGNIHFISSKMAPFIRAMMDSGEYNECDYGMVIDIFQLLPEHYVQFIDSSVCDIYYLGTSDVTPEERFELLKKYDTPKDYTYYITEEENENECADIVEISKKIKEQCKIYNLPYCETSNNREQMMKTIFGF